MKMIDALHGWIWTNNLLRMVNILKIKSATSKGYEEATEGDSINFSVCLIQKQEEEELVKV
jgi:hypothetical protein